MTKKIALLACLALFLATLPALPRAAEVQQGLSVDAKVALNGYTALVEAHLQGVLTALETLASTQEARSADWKRIQEPLAQLARGVTTHAAVWFVRPDGAYFTVAGGLADQSLKDRAYFPGLMAGQAVEGDLVVSKATGKKSIIIATPVKKAGKVIGALGVSIATEKLAGWVDDKMELPQEVVFYALDARGRTALHRETALMFEFPSEMGSESLHDAVQQMLSKPDGTVQYTFRGAQKTAIFERSKATGWVFVLGFATTARTDDTHP
jgi:methyl-accepting chemotaxis protein